MLSLLLLFPYILRAGEAEDVDKAPRSLHEEEQRSLLHSRQLCYRPPRPDREMRWAPDFLYHVGMLHIRDNYTSAQPFSSERQKEKTTPDKHTQLHCFLSSDLVTSPFPTLQFKGLYFTCCPYSNSRNTWIWEATSRSGQLLFPSLQQPGCSSGQVTSATTERGEILWELAPA